MGTTAGLGLTHGALARAQGMGMGMGVGVGKYLR